MKADQGHIHDKAHHHARHHHKHISTLTKATLFGMFILVAIIANLIIALNSGRIILGTEMNTNGLVEYLCLGAGCENLSDMRWSDG